MRISDKELHIDWGQLAFATFIATVAAFYLYDTTSVSMNLSNIILVVPLTLLILALYGFLVAKCVTFGAPAEAEPAPAVTAPDDLEDILPDDRPQSRADLIRAFLLLGGVGLYVSFYQLIGLDIATFIFMIASMILLGVRGKVLIAVYATVFTVVVVGGAHWLLPYPMPMALF